MWSPIFYLTSFVLLYLYAGHQTWWRMLVTDPKTRGCGITAAVVTGTLPLYVYAFFITFWLPLMVVGWLTNKL